MSLSKTSLSVVVDCYDGMLSWEERSPSQPPFILMLPLGRSYHRYHNLEAGRRRDDPPGVAELYHREFLGGTGSAGGSLLRRKRHQVMVKSLT